MRIAIVGSGISGLVSAALAARTHDVTVFEAGDHVGGHTHTHRIERFGQTYHVDSGFIVFNPRAYPGFCRLLQQLGVASHETTMSFSVRDERDGLEYNGTDLNRLFAQRRNLVRPSFLRMVADILRFFREAPALLDAPDDLTLGAYLAGAGYSRRFVEQHIVPLAAAVWSADPAAIGEFPARAFIRFFANHGFLTATNRPPWRVVTGGSQRYVEALTRSFHDRIRLACPVSRIERRGDCVLLTSAACSERFDAVVLATHSDQALRLLSDPSPQEREVLGAIPYQRNEAVLHHDASVLPRSRRARAAWNYHLSADAPGAATVTYDMNALQGLTSPEPFCVTLNRSAAIDPTRVLARMTYHHPVYTRASFAAQRRWDEISGANRTFYCGAYWGYGFHEDGVQSGFAVARQLGLDVEKEIAALGDRSRAAAAQAVRAA